MQAAWQLWHRGIKNSPYGLGLTPAPCCCPELSTMLKGNVTLGHHPSYGCISARHKFGITLPKAFKLCCSVCRLKKQNKTKKQKGSRSWLKKAACWYISKAKENPAMLSDPELHVKNLKLKEKSL